MPCPYENFIELENKNMFVVSAEALILRGLKSSLKTPA
jgi:hypothetical protein